MTRFYQPAPPTNLPDLWPKKLDPPARATLRRRLGPEAKEAAPPVPAHLHGEECLYGYFVTEELVEAYLATHPDARPSNLVGNPIKRIVDAVAQRFGIDIYIDRKRGEVEAIAWFSYTEYGKIQTELVPTAATLEPFEKELGIKVQAQWLGTGLPVL